MSYLKLDSDKKLHHSDIESRCNLISGVPFCFSVTNIAMVFQFPTETELQGAGSPAGGTDEPQPHTGFSPERLKTSEDSSFSATD